MARAPERNAAVVAVPVLIAVTLIHNPTWAYLAQDVDPGTHRRRDTKEIRVTAKKYEYDPAVITVKQGDRVRLIVTALDHDHGFKIEAFHIDQLVKKGESTSIEFSADMTGTFFSFRCSHFCGLGHKGMKGELNVESRALSEVGAFSRSPWLEVQILTVTGSFNVVPGTCIESIRGCSWFVGIPHVFCRSLSAFKN